MGSKVENRLQEILSQNREWAKSWHNPATMTQLRAAAKANGEAVLILTCLDPRCVPEQYFGSDVRMGVIRNAGGRATPDVVTSITALRTLADVKGVFVVHHTDCGMTHMTDEEIRKEAKRRTPDAAEDVDGVDGYGCFKAEEFEETIRKDVEKLRGEKVLGGLVVRGLAFDLDDGVVRVVE